MERNKVDFTNLVTVSHLVETAPAFSKGTVRRWLSERHRNGLTSAVLQINRHILFDVNQFNLWLSKGKDNIFDFRNLRTKEQIIESSGLKYSVLENWLRYRDLNGLNEAVVHKSSRRLYIDSLLFNSWLMACNNNPDFGLPQLMGF